jgi:hypothetical protein
MNNIENINIDPHVDMISIYKMSFIYNAILNGWTVKKLQNNKFEFSNNKDELKKEFYLDNFLAKFINSNLNINHIISSDVLNKPTNI